jgi:hypothetical protein
MKAPALLRTMTQQAAGATKDGTLTNMTPASDWVAGKIGPRALDFDGVDDWVSIPPMNLNIRFDNFLNI